MRILVTGANGFVGRSLVPFLAENGHQIVAASRTRWSGPGAESFVVPSVGPDTDWSPALKGVDAIIHLAARAHVLDETAADPLAEHRRVNTEGTRRLAQQSVEAGVEKFVFMSSIGVLGNDSRKSKNGQYFTEDDQPNPHDDYSRSKWEAEQTLEKVRPDATIIRPPLIYGSGVPGNLKKLIDHARAGKLFPLAGVHNRRSLLGVRNLQDLLLYVLETTACDGEVLLAADAEAVATWELYSRICHQLGQRPKLLSVSPTVLKLGLRMAGREKMVERLCSDLVVSWGKAEKLLCWAPQYSLDFGLQEMIAAESTS